ncbi:MAG: fasciclin domain-containing protein [Caldilinea sp.]
MRKRTHVLSIVLILLALLGIAPAVLAQFTPDIFAVDQPVVDNVVTVTRVTSNGPGWVVIHADADGNPGPVIGYTAVPDGISANVEVEVDLDGLTDNLFAMLHVDADEIGVYEFPDGPDAPVLVRGRIVMKPFAVTAVETTARGLVLANPQFSTLATALAAAELDAALAGDGPFTIFAPTDDAFAELPEGTLDALLADPEQLSQVLLYHVVGAAIPADELVEGELETLQGAALAIAIADDVVTVNRATVITPDVGVANGVVSLTL